MLMLSAPQRDLVRDKGTVLGRSLIGLLFLASGLMTVLGEGGVTGFAGFLTSLSVPFPLLMAWVALLVKIIAGAAIIIGYRVGLASASLILFTIIATLLAHADTADTGLWKNLAIIGGLLYLMAYGPGGSNTRLAN